MSEKKIEIKTNKLESEFLNEFRIGNKFNDCVVEQILMDDDNNVYLAFNLRDLVNKWNSMGCPKSKKKS